MKNSQSFSLSLWDVRPMLIKQALQLTRNPADAEDLVQDTYYKALKQKEAYDTQRELSPWLISILRHTYVDTYRVYKRRGFFHFNDVYPDIKRASETPENILIEKDLQKEVECLSVKLQEPLQLRMIGFTYEEVQNELGISLTAVKQRIRNARLQLKEVLCD